MSHFSVLVFTEDDGLSVEELLEPYYEGNERAPYIEYSKQGAIDYMRERHPEFNDKTDEECWKYMAEGCITDKEGNIYSTANIDAHWDWWIEGGRWENELRLKSGDRVNSAKIKDLDFSPNQEEYAKALRFWDIIVDGKPLEPDEKMPFNIWKPEYYRESYGTRENYAKRQAAFHTYAVVTSDGIWCSPGEVLWWGCSNESPEEAADWENNFVKKFIEGEDENKTVTIVDCHI